MKAAISMTNDYGEKLTCHRLAFDRLVTNPTGSIVGYFTDMFNRSFHSVMAEYYETCLANLGQVMSRPSE